MQVGMDVRVLSVQRQWTGVAQYIAGLVRGYQHDASGIALTGFSMEAERSARVGIPVTVIKARAGIPWQSALLPLQLSPRQVSVFHGPAFSVPPLARVPRVVTVHDLAFVRMPETVNDDTVAYLRRVVAASVRSAATVIVPSAEVRDDLLEWMPRLSAARVRTIPLGADRLPMPPPAPSPLAQPYLLHVGTMEPRKNLGLLLDGFRRLIEETSLPHRLVLVGAAGWKNSDLAEKIGGLGDRVVLPGYVGDQELARYFVHAALYVSVSRYEGFGLGTVEALRFGVPVLATPTGVMRELTGPGVTRLLAGTADELAALLHRQLAGGSGRATLAVPGWRETWRAHARLYREVAGS
ncbi:MAG: glycosyltransferase family 1 protein [Thermaerobacter sp.]|nr:glycosyltransferase family 1 protein [Thermaerobacter sp.]